jgi:hypothetical protein
MGFTSGAFAIAHLPLLKRIITQLLVGGFNPTPLQNMSQLG